MRKIWLMLLLLTSLLAGAQTCKPNQYDMLDWIAPQAFVSDVVVYPTTGQFYWVKSSKGFPWDVDTFDQDRIYQSITEQIWNDPTTYKIFQNPLPWMPRCINVPAVPGKIASIEVQPARTNFDIHNSCASFQTKNLGYVINEVWGPNSTIIGKLPAAPTLTLSFRYSCDSTYSNCHDKETFEMQKGSGEIRWTHFVLQAGTYLQVNQSQKGLQVPAASSVVPVHPCW